MVGVAAPRGKGIYARGSHRKMQVMSLESSWQVMSLDQARLMTSGKERGGDGPRDRRG